MRPTFFPSATPRRALALGLALALIGTTAMASEARAEPVPTVVVQARADGAGFVIDGALQALKQSTVAAQVGGNVLELAVKAGDRVRAGQLLARIDERDPQAALAAAEAGVAQADANLRNAQAQLQRSRDLLAKGFISQAALDVAETQQRAAAAGLDQARAGRAQAALARGFARVAAPFDAVVLATHVEAGDLASPGRPLVTLYAPGRLRAVVQVPSTRSLAARAATALQVRLPDGRWVTPAERTELPVADPVSQTVEWRLDLDPASTAGLAPGQAVSVRFAGVPAAGAAARPVIPAQAVLRRGELTAVYVAQDQRFVLHAVRLGAAQGADGYELLAGVPAGARIALDPVRAGLAGATPAAQ